MKQGGVEAVFEVSMDYKVSLPLLKWRKKKQTNMKQPLSGCQTDILYVHQISDLY